MRPTSIHGSRLQLFRWKFSLNDRDDDVELDKKYDWGNNCKNFESPSLAKPDIFLALFSNFPVNEAEFPFTIFPQYMDPIPFADRSAL